MSLVNDLASLANVPANFKGPPPLIKCLGFSGSELFSPVRFVTWRGNRLEATCEATASWLDSMRMPGGEKPHTPPEEGCICGIYAGTWERARGYLWSHGIKGSVSSVPVLVWPDPTGKIVVHETGWRAQRARVIGLLCPIHLEQDAVDALYSGRPNRVEAISESIAVASNVLGLPVICISADHISAVWRQYLFVAASADAQRESVDVSLSRAAQWLKAKAGLAPGFTVTAGTGGAPPPKKDLRSTPANAPKRLLKGRLT